MKSIGIQFSVLIFLIAGTCGAQELRSYYITCDSAEFVYINSHPEDLIYIDCTLEYDGQVWPDARIRLRGESSLY